MLTCNLQSDCHISRDIIATKNKAIVLTSHRREIELDIITMCWCSYEFARSRSIVDITVWLIGHTSEQKISSN